MRKRGLVAGLAAAALSVAAGSPDIAANFGKTRTISLYNIHTKETISVVYKREGKYVPDAMEKVNWALRDWRKNEPTKMDPELIDTLWEIHTELGSKEPIHIISGYRSRGTNDMLRSKVGGQASQSQHINGKAADVHFPDVPIRQLRYSALIRERGGVGYYPTSAIPFVHVDTARVRHWPRLPRYELALLFPNGRTQHQPADGRPITREDVTIARERHRDLATQVAAFFNFRSQPKATQVAAAGGRDAPPKPVPFAVANAAPPPKPSPAARVAPSRAAEPSQASAPMRVASLTPPPRLVSEPKLIERPSRFVQRPSDADRSKLDELVTLASFVPDQPPPAPRLVAEPSAAMRPPQAIASLSGPSMPLPQFLRPGSMPEKADARVAALTPPTAGSPERLTDAIEPGWGNGFASAPEFDEEHPDELSYRPFPVAPLLTETSSPDDPALAQLTAPDVARTLDLLDSEGQILPMRFHPGAQTAQLLWAQQFKGGAINLGALGVEGHAPDGSGVSSRAVRTMPK